MKDVTRLTWSGSLALALAGCSSGAMTGPIACMMLANGCGSGDGPPTVSSMSPTAGDYGTTITLEGQDLQLGAVEPVVTIRCDPASPVLSSVEDGISLVTSSSATAIDVRFPFPCDGEVEVTTAGGTTIAGSFTPSWKPDTGIRVDAAADMASTLDTIALTGGLLATWIDGPSSAEATLAIWSGGDASTSSIERGASPLVTARFVPRTDGRIEGVAITGDTPPMLVHLVATTGGYTLAPTGVQALDGFLAAGVDATGVYAWVRAQTGMTSRVRPDASDASATWTVDRGPIADPPDYTDSPSGAVAADGTLLLAGGHYTGDFTDNNDTPFVCWLHPTDAAFGACEPAGMEVDDYLISTRLRTNGAGTHLWLTYCSGMNHFLGTPTTSCTGTLLRDADGTWTSFPGVGDGMSSDDLFALSETGFAALVRRDDELQLFTDTTAPPTVLPVWPAGPGAFALRADGSAAYAVSADLTGLLYAPSKR